MSRLYEALRNAQANLPKLETAPQRPSPDSPEDNPILQLLQAVDVRLAGRPRPVIQLVACDGGRASPIARRLASVASSTLQRTVLLFDATPPLPDAAQTPDDRPYATTGLAEQNLTENAGSGALRELWDRLRLTHDMVVVDSPAADTPLGLAIAPTVDGVLLLLSAGKTPIRQAQATRQALVDRGANLLGAVLDNDRVWLPKFLRDRL